MKKTIYFMLVVFLLIGVGCGAKDKPAITIDRIQITPKEFDQAFSQSRFASMGKEGRKTFLESYIASKLILKEAEEMRLDKDPQFLNDIQSFWEKALLKLVLSKKGEELASDVSVSDREVRNYYRKHKKDRFVDKELPEVYDQIKWWLLQEKQSQAMSAWADSLRTKADIEIDYTRLDIEP